MASRISTCLPFWRAKAGPKLVRDLVQQRGRHVALGRRLLSLAGLHQKLGDGQDHYGHARVHEVFEEDFLGALFLMNARVVRQIVGDGLVAVPQIAGAKRRVHDLHGREVTVLRWLGGRVDGERILNCGHVLLIDRQLAAFLFVANQHRGAVGRLDAQQIVEIGFVRREDDVDLGVFQIEPCQVAR
jgi:hypothetical protein